MRKTRLTNLFITTIMAFNIGLLTSCGTKPSSSPGEQVTTVEETTTTIETTKETSTTKESTVVLPPNNRGVLGGRNLNGLRLTDEEKDACVVESYRCWDIYVAMEEIATYYPNPETIYLTEAFYFNARGHSVFEDDNKDRDSGIWIRIGFKGSDVTHFYVINGDWTETQLGMKNKPFDFGVFDLQKAFEGADYDLFDYTLNENSYSSKKIKENGDKLSTKDISAINRAYEYYCEENGWT